MYEQYNQQLLSLLSYYLNEIPDAITPSQIKKVKVCGVSELHAYQLLLINYLNLDNQEIIDLYFNKMLHSLKKEDYANNDYYKNIRFTPQKMNNWEIKYSKYKPYELFVMDDFSYEGKQVIPQLGFFNEPFFYPAIYQNKRLWMSITPNEINTMKKPIEDAIGNVLTFGLGLGYYAYMCANKENVSSITIIEKDKDVISLFQSLILPQFKYPQKIKIIQMDAYDFLKNEVMKNHFDYIFVDIYHDALDGKETYLKFEEYKKVYSLPKIHYWIENTIQYYL